MTVLVIMGGMVGEAAFGWPNWLHARIGHPVSWMGFLITWLDRTLNRDSLPHGARYVLGATTSLLVVGCSVCVAVIVVWLLPDDALGLTVQAAIAAALLAGRNLYTHVNAVVQPLSQDDLLGARHAVSQIVGRDPSQLDGAGIARAALESLAENSSDGLFAPIFWGLLFGLPGLAGYKAVNTLDSIIGHRTQQHSAFGGFAARLDDVANFIPARLTALLFVLVVPMRSFRVLKVIWADAHRHRSPNAGWPESAMAGALNIRLSGPRIYSDRISQEPWLNEDAPDPTASDVLRGLILYRRTGILVFACLGLALLLGMQLGIL